MDERQDKEIYNDEIDLREFFLTLWRSKWPIMGITFSFILIAALYSLLAPKVYGVYMVVEPGIIDVTADGKYTYLDTSDNIKGKIESDAYLPRIVKSLRLNSDEMDIDFKATVPRNANVLIVSTEFPKNKTNFGMQILRQLLVEMQSDYAQEVRRKKDEYQKQILMKQNQFSDIETLRKDLEQQIGIKQGLVKERREQIKLLSSMISISEQRESDLLNDLKDVKGNTQRMAVQRDQMLKQGVANKESGMTDLLYSTTIQQNVVFFNELKNQVNQTRIEKETHKSDIKKLENELNENEREIERLRLKQKEELKSKSDALGIEIADLQNKITQIQNIKTISEPTISHRPIKPRPVRNIALALIGGLFMGVIFVLFSKYIIKK
jgi:LPS O-antigen subunit length determinant protein (WzzB/FepE family)